MQHRMLDLSPWVAIEVPPAQRKLGSTASLRVYRQLSQTTFHTIGDPDRDFSQHSVEVPPIELSVKGVKPMQQAQVAGTSPFWSARPGSRRCVGLDRELQELPLRRSPERPRNPRIEKANHCLQHLVRREGVAPMNPQHPPAEAQHHRLICMGDHSLDIFQAESQEALRQTILEEKTLILHSP
jgi:hypothetical protein